MAAVIDFIHTLDCAAVPEAARRAALAALRDTLAVAVAGRNTELSRIIHDHAAGQFGGTGARLWQDGRSVSPAGAALANGMTIDALDAHDGHKLTKGHVGCGAIPALLALAEATGRQDGAEVLAALVMAYEIGVRSGIALHASVADYHTSGAWVALAAAALGARALGLDAARTREALGIAEYHGPRSQMMRCIDHPTMLKDGSGWGTMAGVSAAYLARDGFTGAPALTVEAPETASVWADLGTTWRMSEQYMKPYPVCRWSQPPVEAVLRVLQAEDVAPGDIRRITITTFHEATRLAVRAPATTEEAQYSLPFPVAAAVCRGRLGPDEVRGGALKDPAILTLAQKIDLTESAEMNAAFPARRIAAAEIETGDGRRLTSGPVEANGDPEAPLSAAELDEKFRAYTEPTLGTERAQRLRSQIDGLACGGTAAGLLHQLASVPAGSEL